MTDCLWHATATEPPVSAPPLQGDTNADVVVVGAGLLGLSAALHLAEAGASVVVLDAGAPGDGASGRSGGQVVPGAKLDPDEAIAAFGPDLGARFVRVVGNAADELFALVRKHGIACDPVQTGWIQPAYNMRGLGLAQRRVNTWARWGAPVDLLDRKEVEQLTGSPVYCGGWLDRRGGTIHPLSYTRGLARAATAAGAQLHGGTQASGIVRADGGWRIQTASGCVRASSVILATNAYTGTLWPGLRRSIVPVFSMQVATSPLSDNLRATILPGHQSASDTRRLLFYFRTDRFGRLLMGGRGPFTDTPQEAHAARLHAAVREIYPQLGGVSYQYRWAGRIAMTQDHLPHLHELAPGLHAALGCNGRGVALGTVLGRILAQRVGGTPAEALDFPVVPLRPLPFHTLSPIAARASIMGMRLMDLWEGRAA